MRAHWRSANRLDQFPHCRRYNRHEYPVRADSLARHLLPAQRFWQAFTLGAIWGWMPCGFVYSVLLIAWLSLDPLRSAATMLLFGLVTMPALLATSCGWSGALRVLGRTHARTAMAVALLTMSGLTAAGPWIAEHAGAHVAGWLPFDCATR